jgi:Outer membrane lipoprotein carrier protein LolA-like
MRRVPMPRRRPGGTPPSATSTPAARRAVRAIALAVVLAAALPLAPRAQVEFDLTRLMHSLAQVRSGEASFTERRHVAMLDQTLEASGRLAFAAPDTFVRETLEPRRERIVVTGNQLTLTQGQRSRTLALDATPEAQVIVEAIRATLTGNREALERIFDAGVAGDARAWRLDLVPRDARVRAQVSSIRIAGSASAVREVHVALADGDRSVMRIEAISASSAASGAGTGSGMPIQAAPTAAGR